MRQRHLGRTYVCHCPLFERIFRHPSDALLLPLIPGLCFRLPELLLGLSQLLFRHLKLELGCHVEYQSLLID